MVTVVLMHTVVKSRCFFFSAVCAAVAAVLPESEPVEPVLWSVWELLRTAGQPEFIRLTVNKNNNLTSLPL